jgi:hypothetical protein
MDGWTVRVYEPRTDSEEWVGVSNAEWAQRVADGLSSVGCQTRVYPPTEDD